MAYAAKLFAVVINKVCVCVCASLTATFNLVKLDQEPTLRVEHREALPCKIYLKMEVTDLEKHTSLFQNGTNHRTS